MSRLFATVAAWFAVAAIGVTGLELEHREALAR